MQRSTPEPLAPCESANFVTHRLVQDGTRWCYRPTAQVTMLLGILRALGAVCAVAGLIALTSNVPAALLAGGCGGLLMWLAGRLSLQYARGSSFDTRQRRIELLKSPLFSLHGALDATTIHIGFDEVEALELLPKRVATTDTDFIGFELNVVRRDGGRCNVVDHHDGDAIAKDAAVLTRLLGVELRDLRPHA